MRAAHAVVVLGILTVLGAAHRGASSDSYARRPVATATADPCPTEFQVEDKCVNQLVTIRFGENPNHPNGPDSCDLMDVQPASVAVCQGYGVIWQFVNECSDEFEARIGPRKLLFPKSSRLVTEPLTTSDSLMPAPPKIPVAAFPGAVTSIVLGTVKRDALCGHYKYEIKLGNVTFDPELEVRKGGGRGFRYEEAMRPK